MLFTLLPALAAALQPLRPVLRSHGACMCAAATGNRVRDVIGDMSDAEAARFFDEEVSNACEARGVASSELGRFDEFCASIRALGDTPPWRPIVNTGQIVLANKYFPRLVALPAWDRVCEDEEDLLFPWLRALEEKAPIIAAELRSVCDADLRAGYCLGEANRATMAGTPGLTDTERSIYVPGFDDRPSNGYCHAVLIANEEPQKISELFPQTMAALDECGVRAGVRLVAFGKQLPHTALHWHSDGRNFMLTAHLPLAAPRERSGERAPPFGPPAPRMPNVALRDGAAGMVLAPLLTPHALAAGDSIDDLAVSRSWQPTPPGGAARGVVFDTSFMHSAYNDGDEPADILFIDFFHPELSVAEVEALKGFQQLLREKGEAVKFADDRKD